MGTTLSETSTGRLPLCGLLAAVLVSTTGNSIASLAIPWYVLTTTGSPAKTGLAAFFGTIPLVLSAFFGGAVVDRLGFKRASVLTDVASGVSVAAIPLLAATVGLPFWALLICVFLGALFDMSGSTARTALLVDLANATRIRLERVNSMEEIALNVPLLVGPPLAGVLITRLGARQVLWLDAASFAVSAALVALLVSGRTERREWVRTSYLGELAEGMRFVRRDRVVFWLITFTALITLVVAPLPSVLLPVYMRATYGNALTLGVLIAAFGIGMLIGVILYGTAGHRLPRQTIAVVGVIGLATMGLMLVLSPPFQVILITALVGGVLYGPFSPLLSTVAGERIPEEVRGRVFGILSAAATVTAPLGVLVVGFGLQALGVRASVVMITISLFAIALMMSLNKPLRELGSDRSEPQP